MEWDGVGRRGTARDGAGRRGTARDGAGRRGTARDGVGRRGTARDGAGRRGTARDGASILQSTYRLYIVCRCYTDAQYVVCPNGNVKGLLNLGFLGKIRGKLGVTP